MTITLTFDDAEILVLCRALEMHCRVQPLGMTAFRVAQRLKAAVEAAREPEPLMAGTATTGSGA